MEGSFELRENLKKLVGEQGWLSGLLFLRAFSDSETTVGWSPSQLPTGPQLPEPQNWGGESLSQSHSVLSSRLPG